MVSEEEVDDSLYVKEKSYDLQFCDLYKDYLEWTTLKPFTGTGADFANWLLQEPQLSKIRQTGGLESIFSDVRRFVKGMRTQKLKKVSEETQSTLDHIARVRELLNDFADALIERGRVHDKSKLEEPEKSAFERMTPILKNLVFGTPEYMDSLMELKPALEHHYSKNSHHPQSHVRGINGMNLLDVVEMYVDWMAASERTKDGSMERSIKVNKDRFNMCDQLVDIFLNTSKNNQ